MQLLIFDKQEKLKTILKNTGAACPFYDAIHEEELNGKNTFVFSVPADHTDAQYVAEGCGVAFKDLDGNYQYFEIKDIEEEHSEAGILKVASCENGVYELVDEYIADQRPTNTTLTAALTNALTGTRWSLGTVEPSGLNSTTFFRINPLAAIYQAIGIWGGEIRIRYIISGTSITGRYIDILSQRGSVTGKRFEYSKDLTRIKRTIDATNVKTALYGYGKGEETADGFGRRIDFKDVVWSTGSGKPTNKPTNQLWVGDTSALAVWGRANGTRHRFGYFEDPDETDPAKLLQKTWDALQKTKKPLVNYDMSVIDLETVSGLVHEKVRLGDTTGAIDKEFSSPIVVQARVISMRRNLLLPENTEISLGNFLPKITDDNRIGMLEQRVHDNTGQWNDKFSSTSGVPTSVLDGVIDVLNNQIQSANGYITMNDSDGIICHDQPTLAASTKAMQIKGGAFRIANSKDGQGNWQWRAFGTGDGFTADEITSGLINADLIDVINLVVKKLFADTANQYIYVKAENGELICNGEWFDPLLPGTYRGEQRITINDAEIRFSNPSGVGADGSYISISRFGADNTLQIASTKAGLLTEILGKLYVDTAVTCSILNFTGGAQTDKTDGSIWYGNGYDGNGWYFYQSGGWTKLTLP